jgi:hypothetical protein
MKVHPSFHTPIGARLGDTEREATRKNNFNERRDYRIPRRKKISHKKKSTKAINKNYHKNNWRENRREDN